MISEAPLPRPLTLSLGLAALQDPEGSLEGDG